MSEIERDEVEPGGAGQDGLAGYEYQMDVSVWLALQLSLRILPYSRWSMSCLKVNCPSTSGEQDDGELARHDPAHGPKVCVKGRRLGRFCRFYRRITTCPSTTYGFDISMAWKRSSVRFSEGPQLHAFEL